MHPRRSGISLANRSRMAHARIVRSAETRPAARSHRFRGEFFSLGGLLAPYATTRLTLAPWAFSAALLAMLGSWDPIATGGEFDAILIGLAGYELLIGLTTDRRDQSAPQIACAPPEVPAS